MRLHLVGGCRGEEDERLVAGLRKQAEELGIQVDPLLCFCCLLLHRTSTLPWIICSSGGSLMFSHFPNHFIQSSVDFSLNVSLSALHCALGEATCGLHTMWNEHFGIGVVEMMVSGSHW